MSNDTNQPPIATLRDGSLKASIWKRTGETGIFYSVTLARGYKDKDDQWQDTTSFGAGDLLRIANLATQAHNKILELKA